MGLETTSTLYLEATPFLKDIVAILKQRVGGIKLDDSAFPGANGGFCLRTPILNCIVLPGVFPAAGAVKVRQCSPQV